MPSSIENLQKFFKLEKELGYTNRAIVGGLDKALPNWERAARAEAVDEDLILHIRTEIQKYPEMDPAEREQTLQKLLERLPAVKDQPQSRPAGQTRPPRRPVEEHAPRREEEPAAAQRPQRQPQTPPPQPVRNPVGLDAPLTVLSGIGQRHAKTLSGLGLNTLEDLLFYFPRRYDDYSQLKPINRLQLGEEVTIIGTIQTIFSRPIKGGASSLTEAVISDGSGVIRANWFNQPWIINRFSTGAQVVLSGKIDHYLGKLIVKSPEIDSLDQDHLHTNRIVPVYSLTAGITQKPLRRMMYESVTFWAPRVPDYLPHALREKAGVMELPKALTQAHFPENNELLRAARERIAFDEILLIQLGVLRQKLNWQAAAARVIEPAPEWWETQTGRLPFALTNAQNRVLEDIRKDLASGRPMNRLVQGDVGSGKTAVAALAMAAIVSTGAQATLMAPTSILAEQHYRTLQRILTDLEHPEIAPLHPHQIRLLVGDTPEAEKREIRAGLESGDIKILIGTHAVIEDPIVFQALQLAVIDEQHRFGVKQRAALRQKGENPHLLVMTATPIPRSLALTVYGDLDVSVIDELPAGRKPIETHVVPPVERERVYTMIRSQLEQGRQAFVIYPLVEQGENEEVKAAVEEQERLQKEVFRRFKVGLLHGRMKPDQKDEVMSRFRDGDYHILVSTSVVEVGVDVPNATVMLIEGANRFGLAQLHQFRGRVGRGGLQSYCILIPQNNDAIENERLAVMAETNDGFILAEKDLQQRGPGDFLGTRQSGFAELHMSLLADVRLIEKARRLAMDLFEEDPLLEKPENAALATRVENFWNPGQGDVS